MLPTTPISPTYEWEYPNHISKGVEHYEAQETNIMEFDDIFLTKFPFFEALGQGDGDEKKEEEGRGGESLQSITSSIDQIKELVLAKRLNRNDSERDRRKRINCLYAVLRTLLPSTDHPRPEKLSTAATIDLVLSYIPQVQKEAKDLISQKQELLSRISSLERELNSQEKKGKKYQNNNNNNYKEKSQHSVFVDRLSQTEIIIRISTNGRTSLPLEVLMVLEKKGLAINHVSSFQFCGERAFYNILLCMEGTSTMKYEGLDEELVSLIVNH